MIVGVTGFFCSGKDTFADYAVRKGFRHISLSDMIRQEIGRRGEAPTIPLLTEVGNELRARFGPGVLAQRALEAMPDHNNVVVTSIRSVGEVETLRTRRDFVMVFVDADMKTRFERSRRRARPGDPETFEAFEAAEHAQMSGDDPAMQQLAACRDAADIVIDNNGALEEFHEKIRTALRRIFLEFSPPRPSWDEYFMNIAHVAASRANCLKRRVGAIITANRQIISTGYNGTPKGVTNCDEGGCPRCLDFADSGAAVGECLCVHAEENAIVQAACNGISVRNGVLYSTLCPCSYCAKSIINAGITEVVYLEEYAMDSVTRHLFKEAGVKFRCLKDNAGEDQ